MSLAAHFGSNRQSSQTTNTLPAPSISAVGSGLVRGSPAVGWELTLQIGVPLAQLAPTLVDFKAAMVPCRLWNGTIPAPSGCTTGWPPRPLTRPPRLTRAPPARPPSLDLPLY